jgi:GAF domain-containing protein
VAELGQRALATPDLSKLMNEAVALVAETLNVEFTKVLELLPDGNTLLLGAGVGWKEGSVARATVGADRDSQAGYTFLSSNPVIVEDLRTETRFRGPPLLHDHGVISGMSVIIQGSGRSFGVFGAHTTKPRKFTNDDIYFLQAVANVLSTTIERKCVEESTRSVRDEAERWRSLIASVVSLSQLFRMNCAHH